MDDRQMRKHMVIRTVTVTVSEIVEAEMDPQEVKDFVDTKVKSLAGVLSDLGLAEKYNDIHYSPGETTVVELSEITVRGGGQRNAGE